MPSSIIPTLSLTFFISALLLFPNPTFSTDSPESSPSPSPSPSPHLPPATGPSPVFLRSPPAPPPSPSPSPSEHQKSPSPVAADGVHVADLDSEGGMSGGKKAGIAIGVIAGGCVVGVAAMLYKKRQNNIRRGQYGYTARGDYP